MAKLIIPESKARQFSRMINALDKRHADACISVFIDNDNNQVTMVGGAPGEYAQIDIELEKGHGLKSAEFSIHFDFFMCMKEQQQEFHALSNRHIFQLNYKNGKYINIEYCLLIKKNNYVNDSIHFPMSRFDLDPPHKNHIHYRKANTQRAYHEIEKRAIVDIINSAYTLIPYDFVEFRKDEKEIRYQKKGEVTTKLLQDNINLPCNLPLTQLAVETLTHIYHSSGSGKVEFSLAGEQLTFKTSQHTQSVNLTGLDQFHKKAPLNGTLILEFSSNMFDLKPLNRMVLKETRVRALNTAMLLFTENRLFACCLPNGRAFIREIGINHLRNDGARLFSYSPRALNDIRLRINQKGGEMRITLTQKQNGELKLNFYKNPDDRLPFESLILFSEQSQLADFLKLKKEYLNDYDTRYIILPSSQGELDLLVDEANTATPSNNDANEIPILQNEVEIADASYPIDELSLEQNKRHKLSVDEIEDSDDLSHIDEYGFADD